MAQNRLIIFDLDGTLVDSLDDLTVSVNYMLAAFGRQATCRDEVRLMVGQGARNLVERAMPAADAATLEHGLHLFLAHNEAHLADRTVPYPGVIATLATLQHAGNTMVVVTNKNEALSRSLISTLGMEHFFKGIYGADSLPARKPSPEPLLHVMAELGYAPANTLMVGDSINDIAAGRGAGIVTVGCTWGYGTPDELVDAEWRIDSLPELLSLPVFFAA